MHIPVSAERAGRVTKWLVGEKALVAEGQALLSLKADPRMTWKPELDDIAQRRQAALELGGPEKVARHRAAGKLTVRERIAGSSTTAASRRSARSPAFRSTTSRATWSASRLRTSYAAAPHRWPHGVRDR